MQYQLVLCGLASIDLGSTIVLNSTFSADWATNSQRIRAFGSFQLHWEVVDIFPIDIFCVDSKQNISMLSLDKC